MLAFINQVGSIPKRLLSPLWGLACAVLYWAAFAAMVPPRHASLLNAVQSWLASIDRYDTGWLLTVDALIHGHWVAVLAISMSVLWFLFWRSIRNREFAPFIVLRQTPVGSSMLLMSLVSSEAVAQTLPTWIRFFLWMLPMLLLLATLVLQAPCESRFWFDAPPLLDALIFPVALVLDVLAAGVDSSDGTGDATAIPIAGGARSIDY